MVEPKPESEIWALVSSPGSEGKRVLQIIQRFPVFKSFGAGAKNLLAPEPKTCWRRSQKLVGAGAKDLLAPEPKTCWRRSQRLVGAGAKNLLAPEPRTCIYWCRNWRKNVDAWNWIRSRDLKFEFQLHSPDSTLEFKKTLSRLLSPMYTCQLWVLSGAFYLSTITSIVFDVTSQGLKMCSHRQLTTRSARLMLW